VQQNIKCGIKWDKYFVAHCSHTLVKIRSPFNFSDIKTSIRA
jgi:hypothetical protein